MNRHSTYDPTPELARKLALSRGSIPEDTKDATVYVADTLELAWCAARQVFGEIATPEVALEIFDRIQTEAWRIEKRREIRG